MNTESKSASHSVVSESGTPWTVACQAPLSMGFSRQEYIPCVISAYAKYSNAYHLFCSFDDRMTTSTPFPVF